MVLEMFQVSEWEEGILRKPDSVRGADKKCSTNSHESGRLKKSCAEVENRNILMKNAFKRQWRKSWFLRMEPWMYI